MFKVFSYREQVFTPDRDKNLPADSSWRRSPVAINMANVQVIHPHTETLYEGKGTERKTVSYPCTLLVFTNDSDVTVIESYETVLGGLV